VTPHNTPHGLGTGLGEPAYSRIQKLIDFRPGYNWEFMRANFGRPGFTFEDLMRNTEAAIKGGWHPSLKRKTKKRLLEDLKLMQDPQYIRWWAGMMGMF
jgi:hypothetical protein